LSVLGNMSLMASPYEVKGCLVASNLLQKSSSVN
jgi:hypothetical protein